MEICQEIDGLILQDDQNYDNGTRINLANTSTDQHDSHWFSFRLPKTADSPVYLRIEMNAPIPDGESIYVDDVSVVAGRELYDGGPWIAAFSGATAALLEDNWDMVVANDRESELQEWYHRCFDTAGKGLLLPISGTTLIQDTDVIV